MLFWEAYIPWHALSGVGHLGLCMMDIQGLVAKIWILDSYRDVKYHVG